MALRHSAGCLCVMLLIDKINGDGWVSDMSRYVQMIASKEISLFRRVRHVLELVDKNVCCHVLNVNDEIMQILRMFGEDFEKYYL